VCGLIFLKPALDRLLGIAAGAESGQKARLGRDLGPNDRRQDYLRSTLAMGAQGELVATPFEKQDSSMLSLMVRADCLVVRPPHDPARKAGALVDVLTFPAGRLTF
jgi:molybdopterin molybdotransferase